MKTIENRGIGASGYTNLSIFFREGDREAMDAFFSRHRQLKKGDFYRDAILEAMERFDAIAEEREAIRSGRTQIDPALVREA